MITKDEHNFEKEFAKLTSKPSPLLEEQLQSHRNEDNAMLASTHTPILRDHLQRQNYSASYSSSPSESSAMIWVLIIAFLIGAGLIGYFVFF